MINQKDIVKYLIESKSQRPVRGTLRNIILSLLFTLIAIIYSFFFMNTITVMYIVSIFIIACFISFLGWGAERLWYAYISNLMKSPFSLISYLTRIPFWFVSGGVAVSFSTLLVYKFNLIDFVSSTKQYLIFLYGAMLNIILQIPLQLYTYHSILKKFKNKTKENE